MQSGKINNLTLNVKEVNVNHTVKIDEIIQSDVSLVYEDGVLIITLCRPEAKGAFTSATYSAFSAALHHANHNQNVRCILIKGSDGCFSIGNDLDGLKEVAEKSRLDQATRRFLQSLVDNQKPVVACVDGAAIGIGATMLFHCDYIVATKRSFFKTPFVDLHVTPEAASSLLGPLQLGYRKAFRLLCLGERWSAVKALEYDFIDDVAETFEVAYQHAINIAFKLASKPTESMMCSRNLLRESIGDMTQSMHAEIISFEKCISRRIA